jgi:hypothetical protein
VLGDATPPSATRPAASPPRPRRQRPETLLSAWARYEDELAQAGGARHQAAVNTRNDWGRVARTFLATDE